MRIPSFFASFEKRFASRCHRRTAMPIDPSPWRSRYPKQQHPIDSRLPTFFFLSHHIISNHPLTTHYSLLTTTSTTTTTMKFPLLFSRSSRSSSSSSSCWSSFSTTVLLLVAVVGTSNLPTCHSSSAAAAGSAALSSALKNIDYRYFVAGGTCAAFSHGITTPIDVVKTKIQANPKQYNKGLLDATIQICKTDGPATLLQGLGPTVVGYGVEGAMKFGVYEVCKPIFLKIFPNHKGMAFVLSSFLAGAVAAVLLVPMESLRIKQVTDPNFQHESLWTGIPKLIRQDGLLSIMMSGTLAMLAKQVPYTFGKQVSFDVIAATLYQVLAQVMQVVNKWLVSILSAFCASIVACLCSQPGDMILTETYKGTTGSGTGSTTGTKPEAFATVVQNMYRRGGPAEFFRGTGARIVHVGMIITSQLVVYDLVKQLLGLPATGSH